MEPGIFQRPVKLVKEIPRQNLTEKSRHKSHAKPKRKNSLVIKGRDSPAHHEQLPIDHLCARCGQEIIIRSKKDQKITSDDGLVHWHLACFTCQHCNKSLIDVGYFESGNNIYCDSCMDEHICKIICSKCNKLVMQYSQDEELYSSLEGEEHWHRDCIPLFCETMHSQH